MTLKVLQECRAENAALKEQVDLLTACAPTEQDIAELAKIMNERDALKEQVENISKHNSVVCMENGRKEDVIIALKEQHAIDQMLVKNHINVIRGLKEQLAQLEAKSAALVDAATVYADGQSPYAWGSAENRVEELNGLRTALAAFKGETWCTGRKGGSH